MTASDDQARLRELIERVTDALGLAAARVEVTEDDETLTGVVHADDLGLFIGRHGQTIDAVQHLAQRILAAGEPGRRVVIDAEGYRARRAAALTGQADDAAAEALRNGRPVALDAMVASERKLVHEHLRERGDVETWSEGDEPDRHLVIAPAKGS
ncbi:MAG TPA: R3H domain-containing nucleic acid-binding protein [Solirubrobacteraceae bacterium]|nr:R3H domain-containing nucleic acid-binding protein [Solirubrobacteraceae bacterium]